MESIGEVMSTPAAYRDIGSTFMANQMPYMGMPYMGMPYMGSSVYGNPVVRRSVTSDKFESVQKYKEEQKKQIKKTVGVLGGVAAAAVALVVLRKKVPAVDKFITKAWDGCKNFVKDIFKKTPKMKALPPHVG